MTHPIVHLEIYLHTLLNNEPINRQSGNIGQADLEIEAALETRDALITLYDAADIAEEDRFGSCAEGWPTLSSMMEGQYAFNKPTHAESIVS